MAIQKILIVEDSPTERHLLANILTNGGYQVGMAECGEEALEKTKQSLPDLILMDVVMPGINGFQATRMITKDKMTEHIPVIICTSKNLETDKIWGLRQGAKEYLTKPINAKELLRKISLLNRLSEKNPVDKRKQKKTLPKKDVQQKATAKKSTPKNYEAKVFRSGRKSKPS